MQEMMDDSIPTHKRRKLVKNYQMCSLENGQNLLKYAGRPTLKTDDKVIERTTPKIDGKVTESQT